MPSCVGEVGDPGGAAAVDAGDVAERVQFFGPGLEEGEGGGGGAGGARVGLHVEVDRAAGAHRHRGGLGDRVDGRFFALRGGPAGAELGAAGAAAGRRLQADVGGDQVPAGGGLGADPARGQVRLRAAAVGAADVDADRPVGRVRPGRHRARGGRRAGVEAEPGEDAAAGRGGGDPAWRGRQRRARGPRRGARFDQDRPLPPEHRGRAVLVRRRRPQVDRAAVEPHAHPRVLGEPVDRPGAWRLHSLAVEVEGARGGEGGSRPGRRQGKRRQQADKERARSGMAKGGLAHARGCQYNRVRPPKLHRESAASDGPRRAARISRLCGPGGRARVSQRRRRCRVSRRPHRVRGRAHGVRRRLPACCGTP